MEVSIRTWACLLICITAASAASCRPPSSSAACCRPHEYKTFIHDLNSQCPLSIPLFRSHIQVDGELFENVVGSSQNNLHTAVLYYASWCPFSSIFQSQFSTLSSMYPQIRHLAVEQSSAVPSVFSRFGIHSVPTLLIVNQTTRVRYHGPRDLESLVTFYMKTTGLDPIVDAVEDGSSIWETGQDGSKHQNGGSFKETVAKESYLVLSTLFVLSRVFLYFFPEILSHLMAVWFTCIPHFNSGIFGESRQLLGRVFYLIDVKRLWSKLKLSKTRNFQEGARNARVWASSLASVSIGETSSSKIFPPRDS